MANFVDAFFIIMLKAVIEFTVVYLALEVWWYRKNRALDERLHDHHES